MTDLREILAAATPGPWKYSFESVDPEWAVVTIKGGSVIANVNADHRQEANASLIALAPDLAAEVLALREENAKLGEALAFYADENRHGLPSDGPWGLGSDDFGRRARAALSDIKKITGGGE